MHVSTIRTAFHLASVFTAWLAAAMLLPAAVDLYQGNPDWRVFVFGALFTGGGSLAIALATRGDRPASVNPRLVFLTVNLLWLGLCIAGAIPLWAASLKLDITDAMFESMSAITTTGATVITGLDGLPPGILLWRSLLQWIGGLGVIALGVFLLPFLKVGGMSFFKVESSEIAESPFSRFATFAGAVIGIYAAMTAACTFAYIACGMTSFEAVNHALTTLSTGGFSTTDASFIGRSNITLWVSVLFMVIGALPFSLLMLFIVRRRTNPTSDPQIRMFLYTLLVLGLINAAHLISSGQMKPVDAFSHSAFSVVSVVTTTGYVSSDYSTWGPLAVAVFFIAMFLGGCSGSTAGGIKSYRIVVLSKILANGLNRLIYPNRVAVISYGTRTIDSDTGRMVLVFVAIFMILLGFGTVLLAATGLDFITAFTGMLTALSNVGPGLGEVIGPVGNFATINDPAKWVLIFGMLAGRLEILTVIVLFVPAFWTD